MSQLDRLAEDGRDAARPLGRSALAGHPGVRTLRFDLACKRAIDIALATEGDA